MGRIGGVRNGGMQCSLVLDMRDVFGAHKSLHRVMFHNHSFGALVTIVSV